MKPNFIVRMKSILKLLMLFQVLELILGGEEGGSQPNNGGHGCSSACKDREALKALKLQMVKSEILDRLGLSHPPNGTLISSARIKQFLKRYRHLTHHEVQVVQDVQGDESLGGPYGKGESMFSGIVIDSELDDHFQMQIINVMTAEVPSNFPPEIQNLASSRSAHFLYFNLQPQIRDLSRADLYLHLPQAPGPKDLRASIHLYYVTKNNTSYALSHARSTKVNLKRHKGGWVDLKVFDISMFWIKYPENNLGFILEIFTNTGKRLPLSESPEPYLKLDLIEESSSKRRKRTLSKICNEETDASTTNCCLWPLEVDFHKEYGWEFIIFPSKYEANYCAGDCSIGVTPEYTHTHLMMQNQKSQAGLSPCCTPKKISPVPLMYIDENENVILGKIPNMKVDRCGCA